MRNPRASIFSIDPSIPDSVFYVNNTSLRNERESKSERERERESVTKKALGDRMISLLHGRGGGRGDEGERGDQDERK